MKFSTVRRGCLLLIVLVFPFLSPQPAKAFFALQQPAYPNMTSLLFPPPATYSAPLQQAIALLEQEKYAEADNILRSLIQSSPKDMPARDFYHTSQDGEYPSIAQSTQDMCR
jgi:hypothetical protein